MRRLTPQQFHELIDGKARVGDDSTQRACPNLAVVWHYDSGSRIVAPENHVTSGLPAKDKTGALEGDAHLPAG